MSRRLLIVLAALVYTSSPAWGGEVTANESAKASPAKPGATVFSDEGREPNAKPRSKATISSSFQQSDSESGSGEQKLKQGRWSYESEQLARKGNCISTGQGALVTNDQGYRQTYEIQCQDGRKWRGTCDNMRCTQM